MQCVFFLRKFLNWFLLNHVKEKGNLSKAIHSKKYIKWNKKEYKWEENCCWAESVKMMFLNIKKFNKNSHVYCKIKRNTKYFNYFISGDKYLKTFACKRRPCFLLAAVTRRLRWLHFLCCVVLLGSFRALFVFFFLEKVSSYLSDALRKKSI